VATDVSVHVDRPALLDCARNHSIEESILHWPIGVGDDHLEAIIQRVLNVSPGLTEVAEGGVEGDMSSGGEFGWQGRALAGPSATCCEDNARLVTRTHWALESILVSGTSDCY
jgi:hypothetical protein